MQTPPEKLKKGYISDEQHCSVCQEYFLNGDYEHVFIQIFYPCVKCFCIPTKSFKPYR